MYPSRELTELEVRKTILRHRIAARRMEVVEAVDALVQPLELFDRVWAAWQRVSPVAKMVGVPVAMFAVKKLFRRVRKIAWLARFAPLVFKVARMMAQPHASAEASAFSR